MTADIERRVADWVRRHELTRPGETVLVALSGGADSVCLLRVLLALGDELDIRLVAAHYNHRLRGAEADRDEGFVRSLCRALEIPLEVGSGDVAGTAARTGRGVEETARDMRYAFLRLAAERTGAEKIATAHNADDNVETILLNMTRGAGLRGLAGIPVARDGIIRPLLGVERTAIEAHLAALGQPHVEDGTNGDSAYRRNALRHQVLPRLREMNPNLAGTLARQSALLRRDGDYLDRTARAALAEIRLEGEDIRLDRAGLLALDPAISTRVLALALDACGGESGGSGGAGETHIRQIMDACESERPSAETHLPGGVTVRREYGVLVFCPPGTAREAFSPVELPPEGAILLEGAGYRITCGEKPGKIHKSFHTFLFKCDAICGKITVRPRRAGDTLRPAGRNISKSVKKLLIEHRVPAALRDSLPVFADEVGVIAVTGVGVDERVSPGPGDKTIRITVEEIPPCTKTSKRSCLPRPS